MLVLFFSENLFLCFLLIKYVFCLTYSIKNQIKLTEFWYFGPVLVLFSALLLFDTGEYLLSQRTVSGQDNILVKNLALVVTIPGRVGSCYMQ